MAGRKLIQVLSRRDLTSEEGLSWLNGRHYRLRGRLRWRRRLFRHKHRNVALVLVWDFKALQ